MRRVRENSWPKLFGLSMLLISLQSYYFPGLGLSPFPVIGSVLLLVDLGISRKRRLNQRSILLIVFFLFFFGWLMLTSMVNGYGTLVGKAGALVFNMITVGALIGYKHDAAFWDKVFKVGSFVVMVHLGFWAFQLGYWLLTREVFDFLSPITGEIQRVHSAKGLLLGIDRVPRFSGLFSEPGTYSNYMYILLIIRTIASQKYDNLGVLASLTMVLSMSLYGAIFAVIYLLLYALTTKRKIIFYGALVSIFWVGISAIGYVYTQLYWRIEEGLGITGRTEAITNILAETNILLGLSHDKLTFPTEDLTLYVAAYVTGGIFLLGGIVSAQVFMLIGKKKNMQLLLSTVFLAKIKLAYPILWVVVVLGIFRRGENGLEHNKLKSSIT